MGQSDTVEQEGKQRRKERKGGESREGMRKREKEVGRNGGEGSDGSR